jgi:hypothetical protein
MVASTVTRPCSHRSRTGTVRYLRKDDAMTDQTWNINREVIHHLAEVCLLRDLYLHTEKEQ